jgi:hypothetical protein
VFVQTQEGIELWVTYEADVKYKLMLYLGLINYMAVKKYGGGRGNNSIVLDLSTSRG